MRPAGLALVIVLALSLALPLVDAQTRAQPVEGKYYEVYVIAGRALDSDGNPVAGGRVIIELDQRGVTAEPLTATANCKGDFITSFTLRYVDPKGRAKITLLTLEGERGTSKVVELDPFWRRTDTLITMDEPWGGVCTGETNVWGVSASVVTRILNRTAAYRHGEYEFQALPYTGIVRLRYEAPDGNTVCPPHPQDETPGACELFVPDDRGDVRYTFTLDQPFPAGGRVQVLLQDNTTYDVPIDTATRLGVKYYEATGLGPPPRETPGAPFALVALALGALALARRGARDQR